MLGLKLKHVSKRGPRKYSLDSIILHQKKSFSVIFSPELRKLFGYRVYTALTLKVFTGTEQDYRLNDMRGFHWSGPFQISEAQPYWYHWRFGIHVYFFNHAPVFYQARWLKQHDIFTARDAKAWQREFPVGFPVRACASNLLLINIFSILLLV